MFETKFTVLGVPQTKGNHRMAKVGRFWKVVDANKKLKPWERAVRLKAGLLAPPEPLTSPVVLEVAFFFCQPKTVKRSQPTVKTVGDLDKLLRAVGDALTGVIYKDDSQIVAIYSTKAYGLPPRALITVKELPS